MGGDPFVIIQCLCESCNIGDFVLGGASSNHCICFQSRSSCKLTDQLACKDMQRMCCFDSRCMIPPAEPIPFAIGLCNFFLTGEAPKEGNPANQLLE